jgi:hypothetical protein
MIDVDRPSHQWAVNNMQTLLAARYDAVVQRLLYPQPGNEAFTSVIHDTANASEYVVKRDGVHFTQDCWNPAPLFRLDSTLAVLELQQEEVRDTMPPKLASDPAEVDRKIVNDMEQRLNLLGAGRLQWLICFGIIGARNKPRLEDVQEVLRQEVSKAPPEDLAFRRAVKALAKRAIDETEETAMLKSLPKQKSYLYHPLYMEGAKAKIERFYSGILARRVLAALLHPFTTAQHMQDEIDVMLGNVPPAYTPYVPQYGDSVPTITLPWPILPPGERPARQVVVPRLPSKPRSEGGQKRVYDDMRTKWLASVVLRWPYGAKFGKVDLHNKTDEKVIETQAKKKKSGDRSRYRAAVLKGPDGSVFAVIADSIIAYPENAMYAGVADELHNEQGQPINWRRVFRSSKDDAKKFGARRFRHNDHKTKLTARPVQARALDYICEAFEKKFGYPVAFKRKDQRKDRRSLADKSAA